jgi:hypothetical protein
MPTINEERIVDPVLTNFGLAYQQDQALSAHDALFPTMDTSAVGETGKYYIHDANTYFRRFDSKRADGAEARAVDFQLTSAAFTQEEYALKAALTDRQKKNSMNPLNLEQGRVKLVTDLLNLDREILARNKIFTPFNFTPEKTVSPLWNAASAVVMTDVVTIIQNFIKLNGKEPNILLIPPRIWAIFMEAKTTDTVGWVLHERCKYVMATTGQNITPNLVAQLFNLNGRVFVPNMIYTNTALTNTAVGGAGITAGAFIWDVYVDDSTAATSIVFAYVDPDADEMTLTLGWNFQSQGYEVARYREPQLRKEWYEAGRVEDRYIVAASCLYRVKVI